MARIACLVLTACLAAPDPAAAQRQAFADGLIDLNSAAAGTFGQEGPRLRAALERMAAALDVWDQEIGTLEAKSKRGTSAAAVAYAQRGRPDEALREIDAALRVDPGQAHLHELRGLVLDASGRAAEAANAFRAAWQRDPAGPGRAYLFLRNSGSAPASDVAKAREVLVAAYRRVLDGKAPAFAPFVRTGLFADTATAAPVLPHASYAEAYRLIARGEYRAAIVRLRDAVAADPLVADPASRDQEVARGALALAQDRIADAIASLEPAAARMPGSSEAQRVLALAYWADGRDEASLRRLEAAIAANPRDERSRLTLARVLMQAGRPADAVAAFRETVRELPDSGLAHWWLGSALEDAGDKEGARRSFERAADVTLAGQGRLYASIGRLARVDGDFTAAYAAFERRVQVAPNDTLAHTVMGRLLLERGQVDEAFDELTMALLLDPANAEAYAAMGQVHLHAGRHRDAVAALRRALELRPADHQSRYALASALFQSGDTVNGAREMDAFERAQREALAGLRRGMAIDVLKEEARLRAAEGRHDRAAALWQDVVIREPESAGAHSALADSLAAMGRVEAAITQYERALALGGERGIYRQLEVLYAAAGRAADSARARALAEQSRPVTRAGDGR